MASATMQLCLVNNDPTATLLVSSDGEPMYSIETPPLPHSTYDNQPAHRRPKSATTTVKRLNRYHQVTGPVETAVGVVEYKGMEAGTHMQLCADNQELSIAPWRSQRSITDRPPLEEGGDQDDAEENSWEFLGPDSRRYKWQMFLHSPVLMLADSTHTPLARYRRAKLGIVSRSRRAFLEILPLGLNILDLIIVTFVAFMKQRVLVDSGQSPPTIHDHFAQLNAPVVIPPMTAPHAPSVVPPSPQ